MKVLKRERAPKKLITRIQKNERTMKKKKIQECLKVEQVLTLSKIEIGEDETLLCPLHNDKKSMMKHYKELNAVACMNPDCAYYQQVFNAMDLLQAVQGGKKQDATALAEELLIQELEGYRARKEPVVLPIVKQEEETAPHQLTEGEKEFLLDVKIFLSEKQEEVFTKKELDMCLDLNESTMKRYLRVLQEPGYIGVVGGSRYKGFVYELVRLPE